MVTLWLPFGHTLVVVWSFSSSAQAVEQYTSKQNARIQRDDDDVSSSGEFDEHKSLLSEAMNEPIVT